MTQEEIEKVNSLLMLKYNVFHADLITRAIQDENYLEFIFEDGKYYSATIFGNCDFTHHQANFEFIK